MWVYAVLVALQLLNLISTQSTIRVHSKLGEIEGIVVNKNGKIVNQFRNLPYAHPPVGDLRFKQPVPIQSWTGVYNGTAFGSSCMQVRYSEEFIPNTTLCEDCLYLNIYVPNKFCSNANKSVMVWVHGGGFVNGEAESYNSSNLSLNGDVIVVTINYRLGVFGFLSTGDQESPGNYGLWDQLMAIRWVKENILEFGGNPNSITIFGESAGSFSVCDLLLAPQSDGLFQRVIGESGSCLESQNNTNLGIEAVKTLAKLTHCPLPSSGTRETINCLRKIKAITLLHIVSNPQSGLNFFPVIDGDIIPDYQERLLENTSSKSYALFSSRDILFGVNSAEGSLYLFPLEYTFNLNLTAGIPTTIFCNDIVPYALKMSSIDNVTLEKAVCEFYKVNNDIQEQSRNVINFLGDLNFVAPTLKLLNFHNASSKATYQYLFSQQLPYTHPPLVLPPWFRGATHGDELGYVFGMLEWNPAILPGDQALANLMMTYWTNFSKYGNPNGTGKTVQTSAPVWPSYFNNKSYINFSHNSTVENHVFQKRMQFWLHTATSLGKKHPDASTSVFG